MSDMAGIVAAAQAIRTAESVLIVAHRSPDGDTIGSMLGLGLVLDEMGKNVTMACEDPVPARLRFLPGWEKVVREVSPPFDLAVAVDCAEETLLGAVAPRFQEATVTLQIDHHALGKPFARHYYIDLGAAAVGEMIYRMAGELGRTVGKEAATCLMASVMEDTGGFRYSNVTPDALIVAGELLRAGADFPRIIENLYWTRSPGDIRLAGKIMADIRLTGDGAVAWSLVTVDEMARYGADEKEVGEVVNDLRTIRGTRVAVLFRERADSVRVSLRSRGDCDVATVAAKFGGGGHVNAAGCTIKTGEEARSALLEEVSRACMGL